VAVVAEELVVKMIVDGNVVNVVSEDNEDAVLADIVDKVVEVMDETGSPQMGSPNLARAGLITS
jgi:hypothetical protein